MAKVRDSDRESNIISNFLGDLMSLALGRIPTLRIHQRNDQDVALSKMRHIQTAVVPHHFQLVKS